MFKGQIIDLTRTLIPGREDRRLEIRRIVYELDKTFMHEIDTISHIGTHIEAPSHFNNNWKDISQIPISSFIGEAICIDLSRHEPKMAIEPRDMERNAKVKKGDIVLLHSPYKADDRPYISQRTAKWLREKGIKMLGIDDTIRLEESYELMTTHIELLGNDIPIIEGLYNLDQVVGSRFYFIALPLKVAGLDSSPVRAIAIVNY